MKHIWRGLAIGILILCLGYWSYSINQKATFSREIGIAHEHEAMKLFRKDYPQGQILRGGEEDLNDDGRKDVVLVYHRRGEEKNFAVVMIRMNQGSYEYSQPIVAPRENVDIQFKNIDDKDQIEFILSGSKEGRYGYAIYRWMKNGELRDLFSEDMDECC